VKKEIVTNGLHFNSMGYAVLSRNKLTLFLCFIFLIFIFLIFFSVM
jgi:hypothetical protein